MKRVCVGLAFFGLLTITACAQAQSRKLTPQERFARTPAGKAQAKQEQKYQDDFRKIVSSVFVDSKNRSAVKRLVNIPGQPLDVTTETISHYIYTVLKADKFDMAKARERAALLEIELEMTEDPSVFHVRGSDHLIGGWEAGLATNGKWGSWPSMVEMHPITTRKERE